MAQNIAENRTKRHTQKRAFKEDLYSLYAQIAPCVHSQMECHRTNKDEEKERPVESFFYRWFKPICVDPGKNQCYSGKETPLI